MDEVDFDEDILEAVRMLVPSDVEGYSEIGRMSSDEAWLTYGSWLSRHIPPWPRSVHVSRELNALLQTHRDAAAVRMVLSEIERGDNVNSRLSKRTRCFVDTRQARTPTNEGPRDLGKRRDLDLLLNDWGLHHLHLGPANPDDTFVKRTKDVLLVSFTAEDAYAVCLLGHTGWSDDRIMRILANNWPDNDVILGSISGLTLAERYDPAELDALRRAGVSVLYGHDDGRPYVGRGMMSTAGTSMTQGLIQDPGMALIRRVQRALQTSPPSRLDMLARLRPSAKAAFAPRVAADASSRSDWHLEVLQDRHEWALRDRASDTVLPLPAVDAFLSEHPRNHACETCTVPPR